MAELMQEKIRKLFGSRSKAETELRTAQQKVQDAVEDGERRVRVERLVSSCEEAMTTLLSKHDLLLNLATKTEDPSLDKHDLESWLSEVTTQNDTILKKARSYIDESPGLRQPLHKISNQAKHQVQKRRVNQEHLVKDKGTCRLQNNVKKK